MAPRTLLPILVDDAVDDEAEGAESQQEDVGAPLFGNRHRAEHRAIQRQNPEGEGEDQEQSIRRLSPESPEVQADYRAAHRAGSVEESDHQSLSRIRP